MFPTLLQLGSLRISSLGLFMVLAFFLALFVVWREARREYLDEEKVLDIFLASFIFGIIGARASFILLHTDKFRLNILRMLLPTWVPGFYIYGGLITALTAAYFISKRKKIQFNKFIDTCAPASILSAFVYKLGQFLDGSLVGKPTNLFFGLPVVGEEGRFIPVSLFQAVLYLAVFIVVIKLRSYFVIKRKITGAFFLASLSLACVVELIGFFLAQDRVYIGSAPVSFALILAAFVISTIILYKKTRLLREDIRSSRARISRVLRNFRFKFSKSG